MLDTLNLRLIDRMVSRGRCDNRLRSFLTSIDAETREHRRLVNIVSPTAQESVLLRDL